MASSSSSFFFFSSFISLSFVIFDWYPAIYVENTPDCETGCNSRNSILLNLFMLLLGVSTVFLTATSVPTRFLVSFWKEPFSK